MYLHQGMNGNVCLYTFVFDILYKHTWAQQFEFCRFTRKLMMSKACYSVCTTNMYVQNFIIMFATVFFPTGAGDWSSFWSCFQSDLCYIPIRILSPSRIFSLTHYFISKHAQKQKIILCQIACSINLSPIYTYVLFGTQTQDGHHHTWPVAYRCPVTWILFLFHSLSIVQCTFTSLCISHTLFPLNKCYFLVFLPSDPSSLYLSSSILFKAAGLPWSLSLYSQVHPLSEILFTLLAISKSFLVRGLLTYFYDFTFGSIWNPPPEIQGWTYHWDGTKGLLRQRKPLLERYRLDLAKEALRLHQMGEGLW